MSFHALFDQVDVSVTIAWNRGQITHLRHEEVRGIGVVPAVPLGEKGLRLLVALLLPAVTGPVAADAAVATLVAIVVVAGATGVSSASTPVLAASAATAAAPTASSTPASRRAGARATSVRIVVLETGVPLLFSEKQAPHAISALLQLMAFLRRFQSPSQLLNRELIEIDQSFDRESDLRKLFGDY